MDKSSLPKREQPRDNRGQFGSLPTRAPIAPTPKSEIFSAQIGNEEVPIDNLAAIYSKFKEKHGRAPVIGLDLDGTAANMTGGWRPRVAKARGITDEDALSKLPEPDEYAMWTGEGAWFETKQEFLLDFQAAEKDGMYRNLSPYDGASEVIHRLSQEGFRIKAVTARSVEYNEDTAHWLNNQGLPIEEILHPGMLKSALEDIDIFIDDAPHVINDLVEHERKVVIFDQGYNDHHAVDSPEHTRRISGWSVSGISQALEELLP